MSYGVDLLFKACQDVFPSLVEDFTSSPNVFSFQLNWLAANT